MQISRLFVKFDRTIRTNSECSKKSFQVLKQILIGGSNTLPEIIRTDHDVQHSEESLAKCSMVEQFDPFYTNFSKRK